MLGPLVVLEEKGKERKGEERTGRGKGKGKGKGNSVVAIITLTNSRKETYATDLDQGI